MLTNTSSHSPRRPVHLAVIVLAMGMFFLSGFAALLYQVVWQRLLAMFSGADVYSATLIVAAFMAGLGLGHLAGGHVADRVSARTSLLLFGAAEVSIGVFGALSPTLYYEGLYQRLGSVSIGAFGIAIALFASLLWPTFFMGASLPLLARTLTDRIERTGRIIGSLYAVNTLGAAGGALFSTWWLLPTYGLDGSAYIGARLNLICAVVLLPLAALIRLRPGGALGGMSRGSDAALHAEHETGSGGDDVRFGLGTWCVLYGLGGLFALAVEIVWFRVLGVMMKSTAFTFGTLLALYLAGLGIGAMIGSALVSRVRRPGLTFLGLQVAIALAAALSLTLLVETADQIPWLWEYLRGYEPLHVGDGVAALGTNSETGQRFLTLYFAIPGLLVVPVTMLMGASFPFLQQAVQNDPARIGRRVGQLLLANIAGSLTGCVLTGWLLLDWAGTAGTARTLIAMAMVFGWLGLVHVIRQRKPRVPATGVAGVIVTAGVAAVIALMPDSNRLWSRLHGSNRPDMTVQEDGSGVSAIRRVTDQAVVFVNGVGQSQLPFGDVHTALGAIPAFIHPAPRSAAIIGLGSGDTAWSAAGRPEIDRVVAIEIIRSQLESLRRLHETWPYGGLASLLSNPRVKHVFADGRTLLLRGEDRYDIIEADALRPSSAYSGNLYSDGYFQLVKDRLNPGGIAATWAPTGRVLNSFLRVFPHVVVLPGILVGSNAPIPIDQAEILRRANTPPITSYYREGHVDILELLEARSVIRQVYDASLDRSMLTDFNTDLFPRDKYDLSPRKD